MNKPTPSKSRSKEILKSQYFDRMLSVVELVVSFLVRPAEFEFESADWLVVGVPSEFPLVLLALASQAP